MHIVVSVLTRLVLLSSFLFVVGCASSFNKLQGVPGAIKRGESKALLSSIHEKDYPKRDWVAVRLERASLMQDVGMYKESFSEFEKAKDLMDEFYTVRVSESNFAANPLEQLQVRSAQILDALATGEAANAAVMARQIDTILSEYEERKEAPFACPPLSWYLASIAFAANAENGNAQVAAQKSQACLDQERYRSQTKKLAIPRLLNDQGQVWLVLGEGFVGRKIERTGAIQSSYGPVKFAWSDYVETSSPVLDRVVISAKEGFDDRAVMVQDLEPEMRKLLEKGGALEKTASVARTATVIAAAHAAYQSAASNDKGGAFLGTIAAIGIIVAANQNVQAEIRSWRSLSRRWWLAHLTLPAGTHQLKVEAMGRGDTVLKSKTIPLTIKSGQILTVFERFLDSSEH